MHRPPGPANENVREKKTVLFKSQSSRRAAHAFAAPVWSKQGQRHPLNTWAWSFQENKDHSVAETNSPSEAIHQDSMKCDQKVPASIPKKVGVMDGFLSTYKCALRVTLAYAVKRKKKRMVNFCCFFAIHACTAGGTVVGDAATMSTPRLRDKQTPQNRLRP